MTMLLKDLLKNGREVSGLKTRELSALSKIDQALISKFESGTRNPTEAQILQLSSLLSIDLESLTTSWLTEKILREIDGNKFGLNALKAAERELLSIASKSVKSLSLTDLLAEIDQLATIYKNTPVNDVVADALVAEYTFTSTHLEGNSLTLEEIDQVINAGVTIPGKTMREHLEVLNHQEAIRFITEVAAQNLSLTTKHLLSIHQILFRGIAPQSAGKYRTDDEIGKVPPSKISSEIENVLQQLENAALHPVECAAEICKSFLAIEPFSVGNAITARLCSNLILLRAGFPISNIQNVEIQPDQLTFEIAKNLRSNLLNTIT